MGCDLDCQYYDLISHGSQKVAEVNNVLAIGMREWGLGTLYIDKLIIMTRLNDYHVTARLDWLL